MMWFALWVDKNQIYLLASRNLYIILVVWVHSLVLNTIYEECSTMSSKVNSNFKF